MCTPVVRGGSCLGCVLPLRAPLTGCFRVFVSVLVQVWPVIGCMAIGGAWLGFVTSRFLFISPDTHWSREERGNMWRTNFAEGKRWTAHRQLFIKDDAKVADTSVLGMEAINRWIGGTSQKL